MTTTGRLPRARSVGGPQTGPRRVRVRTTVLLAVSTALAVVVLLPDRVGLDRVLPFAVFAALRPDLAAGIGVLALVLLVLRRRWWPFLVPALVVAVVAGALVVPRAVAQPAPPPGGTELTVLELNAFEGHADARTIADLARAQHADLIVLPESGERIAHGSSPCCRSTARGPTSRRACPTCAGSSWPPRPAPGPSPPAPSSSTPATRGRR